MDVELVITNPESYDLSPKVTKNSKIIHDQEEALKDADFVYVKNWSSYEQYGKILNEDRTWTFSKEKLAVTNDAKIMHCLPVRRNVVIDDAVLDSENSVVIQQAGNRTFAAQAVLWRLLAPQPPKGEKS
jgi:N-succinyl-L-ornithine transcarbamylase